MILRALANTLLSSLFEPPCAACAQVLAHPLDGAVCEQCWASIAARASLHAHGSGHEAVDWACAVDHYEGRLRDVIHALKYERRRSIAKPLGRLMRERGGALLRGAGAAVPVPLHPRRLRERGFNQADDLARQLRLPVIPLLRRVRFTTSQIELPANARHQNVRDAFALSGNPKGLPPQFTLAGNPEGLPPQFTRSLGGGTHTGWRVGGGNPSGLPDIVVLVDDVSTTGATLEACARVLKAAGVKEVRALTAARVVTGRR